MEYDQSGEECLDDDCSNSTGLLPPNACFCELASTQFKPEYATFNLVLIVIILPILAIFGILTNALALFVYTRSRMLISSTTNFYLAALAVCDIFVNLCGIFSIAIDSARRFDPILNEIHLAIIPYTLPLCYMAQMCSIYFTVLAAFDCYSNIRHGHSSPVVIINHQLEIDLSYPSRPPGPRRSSCAKFYTTSILIASFLYNCITFADLYVVECVDYSSSSGMKLKRELCPTHLRMDPVYNQIYKVYMYAVFMTFLPFSVLLTLNCLIVWKIYRISVKRTKIPKLIVTRLDSIPHGGRDGSNCNENNNDHDDEEQSRNENTLMLVMVVALFLVCNSIALVVNIIETFGNYPLDDTESANRLFYVIDVGNFLVVFNSSANFLIYYAFSKDFRNILMNNRDTVIRKISTSISSFSSTKSPGRISRNHESSCTFDQTLSSSHTLTPNSSRKSSPALSVNRKASRSGYCHYEILSTKGLAPTATMTNGWKKRNGSSGQENGSESGITLTELAIR